MAGSVLQAEIQRLRSELLQLKARDAMRGAARHPSRAIGHGGSDAGWEKVVHIKKSRPRKTLLVPKEHDFDVNELPSGCGERPAAAQTPASRPQAIFGLKPLSRVGGMMTGAPV